MVSKVSMYQYQEVKNKNIPQLEYKEYKRNSKSYRQYQSTGKKEVKETVGYINIGSYR